MNRGSSLQPGDVVQIDPALEDCVFRGCFMMVTEVKAFGAEGFIPMPQSPPTPPMCAYFLASWEKIMLVGPAPWTPFKPEVQQ